MSIGCVYRNGLCSRLAEYSRLGRLSERDLSLDDSVAGLFIPGMDLNTLVFDNYGYTLNSTSIVTDLIDAGLKRLYLDVYYDPDYRVWHLCPDKPGRGYNYTQSFYNTTNSTSGNQTLFEAFDNRTTAVCDFQLTFDTLMQSISEYITLSDTNIAANLVYLHLRPKIWDSDAEYKNDYRLAAAGVSSLSDVIQNRVGNRTLTPAQLALDQLNKNSVTRKGVDPDTPRNEQWPSLRMLLYSNYRRLMITYNSTYANTIHSVSDLSTWGFPYINTITDPQNYSINELAGMNFSDTFVSSMPEWLTALNAGVSPVLSTTIDIYADEFVRYLSQHTCWCWGDHQPLLYTVAERENMVKDGYAKSAKFYACASLTRSGLRVENCNAEHRILCNNDKNSFDWIITENENSYFDPDCPQGYHFALPSNPVQLRYVLQLMELEDESVVWSDFNSLFLPNCWVTGGTNAVCPYNVHEDDRNGIAYIVIVGSICWALIVGIFLLEWVRGKAPLARKRLIIERKRAVEYEGVPS